MCEQEDIGKKRNTKYNIAETYILAIGATLRLQHMTSTMLNTDIEAGPRSSKHTFLR